jgi:hypothetical protein
MIDIACPWCHKAFRFNAGGFVATCPSCGRPFTVPVSVTDISSSDDDDDPFPPRDEALVFSREMAPSPSRRRKPSTHPLLQAFAWVLGLVAAIVVALFLLVPSPKNFAEKALTNYLESWQLNVRPGQSVGLVDDPNRRLVLAGFKLGPARESPKVDTFYFQATLHFHSVAGHPLTKSMVYRVVHSSGAWDIFAEQP